jgi:hypothetical protein
MNSIINKLVKLNTLNIVGIFRKEDDDVYFLLKVNKKNSKLEIVSSKSFSDFESLMNDLEVKTPIILLIDGKGILNKRIDLKNETDIDWIKKIDYSSIHFSSFTTLNFQFFSFCRQKIADDSIASFQDKGLQVVDFYIGPIISVLLSGTLKKSKVFSNESVLDFENDELVTVLKSIEVDAVKEYVIGDKSISRNHLPLYGAAIHFYIRQKSINKSHSKLINTEEILYKKAFDKLGLTMIIVFFILLLASYFSIQYFNSKNTQLNLETVYSNQSFELIKKLEEQREKKLQIANETGIASSKYISFYNYEIIASTPNEINLLDVNVFPLLKEIKSNERVGFNAKTIVIKGFTIHEAAFNSWLEKIRILKWVGNLEIISIKKDKKSVSFFELKIAIKNV